MGELFLRIENDIIILYRKKRKYNVYGGVYE